MKSLLGSFIQKKNPKSILGILIFLCAVGAVLSFCVGSVNLSLSEVWEMLTGQLHDSSVYQILFYLRLPRTIAALLAGSALALSGTVIQNVLNNPLAAPNIIGVNAGAGFGAVLCSAIFPAAVVYLPAASFLGAFISVLFVMLIAEKTGASKITTILAGVAVSCIFSAASDAVITLVPDALTGYASFRIGGLTNLTLTRLILPSVMILIGAAVVFCLSNELDILSLGSETAQSLGLPVRRTRILLLMTAAALAGAAISFAGLLGFIGLLAPQIMRRLVGDENRYLLPASALGGAALLLYSDVLSRVICAPYELPVGIVLSFLGGPFFIWLLFHQRGGRAHD